MKKFNPFPRVFGKYGAPMGRHSVIPDWDECANLCAAHQGGSDGYDRGGAYWGEPSDVWGVWRYAHGFEGVVYVRANSRAEAFKKAVER